MYHLFQQQPCPLSDLQFHLSYETKKRTKLEEWLSITHDHCAEI